MSLGDERRRDASALEETTRDHDPRIFAHERSNERFDRVRFASRAIALLGPRRTTVAIAESRRHMHVETGRAWGRGEGARWATLYVPNDASRRAIAVAVLSLGGAEMTPYAIDVLMNADLL